MQFYITRKAEIQLSNLPHGDQVRIQEKLRFYSDQKDPLVFAKFISEKKYRFRIGNYRALFTIENGIIHIGKIEWRDKAYN
jgi:mRNA-degrading endonuclease RelE of RelBE toxin-antitoxin system